MQLTEHHYIHQEHFLQSNLHVHFTADHTQTEPYYVLNIKQDRIKPIYNNVP